MGERVGRLNLGELFDGAEHSLSPDSDFQIPWEEVVEWVPVEGGRLKPGRYEPPEVRMVVRELLSVESSWWGIRNGWTSCNIMAQALAAALGGESKCEERRSAPEEDPFRPDGEEGVRSWYLFRFVPGRDGWQGGEAL